MKKILSFIFSAFLFCSAAFAETQVYSFLPAQIKNLDINFAAGNVTVKTDFTDHIDIVITKEIDVSAPTVKLDKDTLSIKTKILSSFKKEQDIEICIPTGLKLNDVKIISMSANSYIEDAEINNLTITTTSGLIKIKNSKIYGLAKLAGASGKYSAKNSNITNLVCSAVNGEISIEDCNTGLTQLEAANGRISLLNTVTENFEIQTMGGAVTVQLKEMITKNSFAKTTSGTIDITVPKDSAYKAVVTTLNGSFIDNNTFVTAAQCDGLESSYKGGTVEIKLNTKSGKMTLSSE